MADTVENNLNEQLVWLSKHEADALLQCVPSDAQLQAALSSSASSANPSSVAVGNRGVIVTPLSRAYQFVRGSWKPPVPVIRYSSGASTVSDTKSMVEDARIEPPPAKRMALPATNSTGAVVVNAKKAQKNLKEEGKPLMDDDEIDLSILDDISKFEMTCVPDVDKVKQPSTVPDTMKHSPVADAPLDGSDEDNNDDDDLDVVEISSDDLPSDLDVDAMLEKANNRVSVGGPVKRDVSASASIHAEEQHLMDDDYLDEVKSHRAEKVARREEPPVSVDAGVSWRERVAEVERLIVEVFCSLDTPIDDDLRRELVSRREEALSGHEKERSSNNTVSLAPAAEAPAFLDGPGGGDRFADEKVIESSLFPRDFDSVPAPVMPSTPPDKPIVVSNHVMSSPSFERDQGKHNTVCKLSADASICEWINPKFSPSEVVPTQSLPALTTNWSRTDFPWSSMVQEQNRNRFGHTSFRKNQLEIVNAIMAGHDCFILMPTGGGKSLCFQLPTVCREGITIVISPLISLIQDQVDALMQLEIRAAFLNSSMSNDEAKQVYSDLHRPSSGLRLLYLTPEKISASAALKKCLQELFQRGRLQMVVIDEVHCMSQWGHDFRPDYGCLKWFKQVMPALQIVMLTATATANVQADVLFSLGIRRCLCFKQTFNRPNLHYSVRKKTKKVVDDIVAWINEKKFRNKSGIIYCLSRQECEDLSRKLRQRGLKCGFYHAAMEPEDRARVQRSWSNDNIHVVCATVAFGMGIDKPDVRYVIHYCLAKCLENYYQESGRAGRDGATSYCILYYDWKDRIRMENLIRRSARENHQTREAVAAACDNLLKMVSYCENCIECRRTLQLEYFGEKFDKAQCKGTCDNCQNELRIIKQDQTDLARAIVRVVDAMVPQDTLATFVLEVIRGSRSGRITEKGYDRLKDYGMAKGKTPAVCKDVLHQLVLKRVLREDVTFREGFQPVVRLRVGAEKRSLLQGSLKIILFSRDTRPALSVSHTGSDTAAGDSDDQDKLLELLLALREQIAKEENARNTYSIFSQTTIQEMATKRPMTREAFLQLSGVGDFRYKKYGERFMNVIREFCHVPTVPIPPKEPPSTVKKPSVIVVKSTTSGPAAWHSSPPSSCSVTQPSSESPFFSKPAAPASKPPDADEKLKNELFGDLLFEEALNHDGDDDFEMV